MGSLAELIYLLTYIITLFITLAIFLPITMSIYIFVEHEPVYDKRPVF